MRKQKDKAADKKEVHHYRHTLTNRSYRGCHNFLTSQKVEESSVYALHYPHPPIPLSSPSQTGYISIPECVVLAGCLVGGGEARRLRGVRSGVIVWGESCLGVWGEVGMVYSNRWW